MRIAWISYGDLNTEPLNKEHELFVIREDQELRSFPFGTLVLSDRQAEEIEKIEALHPDCIVSFEKDDFALAAARKINVPLFKNSLTDEELDDAYHGCYRLDSLKAKGEGVLLKLVSLDEEKETKLHMTLEDYGESGLHPGAVITGEELEKYQAKEEVLLAFEKCLRKLSASDRSEKEIKDFMRRNLSCSEETVRNVISRLKKLGYLDDERYGKALVNKCLAKLYGKEEILSRLKEKGIEGKLAEQLTENIDFTVDENSIVLSEKLLKGQKNSSRVRAAQNIRMKMRQKGYETDQIEEAVEKLDFDTIDESSALEKEMSKAYKRMKKKYEGRDLENRVFQTCMRKGFSMDDIREMWRKLKYDEDCGV